MTAIHHENEKQKFPQTLILPAAIPVDTFLNQCQSVGIVLNAQDLRELLTQIIEDLHTNNPKHKPFVDLPRFHRMIIAPRLNEDQRHSLKMWTYALGHALRTEIMVLGGTDEDGTFSYFFVDMLGRDIIVEYLPW